MRRTAALFAILFCSASSLLAIDAPGPREKWISLQADEFSIFSNASERETVAVAKNLLRMRDAIGALTMLKVRSALPTKVYIFRDTRNFAPWRDTMLGRRNEHITGLFLSHNNGNFILLNAASASGIDRVVYHELTHYFVRNTLPGLPLWFNEGLAEYYSTFSTRGDDVNLGMIVSEHITWLRDGALISLPELFAIDAKSKDYNEGRRQGVFYAQSWALVHYLMGTPERRKQLGTYLGLVKAGRPIDDAFKTAFGTTFAVLERELRAYIKSYVFAYRRYPLADLQETTIATPLPMPRADVLFQLGDLLTRTGGQNLADAARFLNEALTTDPNHAEAHANLGFIHSVNDRSAEAAAEYEKAIQLGARNASVYLVYGAAILDKIRDSAMGPGGAPAADVAKARGLFQKATELDPTSARAFAGLGATYLVSRDDPTPGIAALEKSMSLSPAQEDTAFYLLQLYARAGRRDEAKRLIDTVIARGDDAEMLARSQEALLIADVKLGETMLRNNKLAEAKKIFETALAATKNDELKAYLTSTLIEIDQETSRKQLIEALKAASVLAESGKFAQALEAVDKVIPGITEPELLAKAKEFRELVAKAAKRKK